MTKPIDVPTSVDEYFTRTLLPEDAVLTEVLQRSDQAGLPREAVSPVQGMWLHIQTLALRARRVLEIGTLGGYSTICMARALPKDGLIVTLEAKEAHSQVARANFELAGVQDRVEIRLGRAVDSLDSLIQEGASPFDLVFIDADKPNNPRYLERVLQLVRPGSLIIADNVVRDGEVAEPESTDPKVQGVREYLAQVGRNPRLRTSALQTVGCKGYDGFAISVVAEGGERTKR